MENLLDLMDALVERNDILNKLGSYGEKCPKLIHWDTYITLKRSTSLFKTDSKFSAVVDISIDQQRELDPEDSAEEYYLRIYVYHKESNRPIIRSDIRFHRLISYCDSVTNVEMKVNYHAIDGFISSFREELTIHNIISLMFENAIDDIKGTDIDAYKYYLKNLKGALEFALVDFIRGE